ncbi:MAG TPA: MATE family efflux transporter [Flavobacteriales bacterium]|nr:MATE family efflux transporter [Flavobacteriales bacterium]HMR28483.1 MATE family efflux transporter [Flavobacteriales bacterium]
MAATSPITRKDIDRLAVPAIISGIAEPLIALVDTAFVGSLGTADLGAVGIASSFFLLVVWVLAQTRSAVLSVVARYTGEQRLEAIRGLVPIAIWMNVGLGIFFHLTTAPFAEDIFRLYNAEGAVLSKAVDYFHIRSIGFPLSLATFAITGAFRGIQNLSWSMWISLLGAAVNLVLNPLLIFGWGPVPGLGIEGSAWASVIAQAVMCATALVMLRTRTPFPVWPRRWHHPELKALWLLSGNLFARTMALNACYYLGNRYATGYGEAHIGAHSIAMQIWLFSAFFIDGYAAAGSVLAGRLNGERNWRDLYRMSWQVVRVSVLIGAALATLYALGYRWIGALFTDDPSVQALFNGVFWLVVLTQPINAIAFAFDGIFKGLGDGVALRNVLLFSTLLVFVPVAWMGHEAGWELYGVWSAFLAWMIARGVWLAVLFQRRHGPHGSTGGARTFGP